MSAHAPAELDLAVASLIMVRPDEDRAEYEEQFESVAAVQDQLREYGIDIDLLSQPGVEVWEGSIETMGALYQLARMAAHLERGNDLAPIIADGPVLEEDLDRAVTDVWDELVPSRYRHLINLQGINSYYLPVDFADPIYLPFEDDEGEEDQAFFGSSVQLLRELSELAPQLIKAGVSPRSDAFRCLESLREAARQSVECGLPVIVW